ncbi:MAG: hypothetical protein ACOY71_14160 [Gemmatimonadota bacterium]
MSSSRPTSPLRIRWKKGRDGVHAFTCVRADGSHSLQHHRTDFFAVHDLTHYAVETILGCERGFYGLIAEGWNLDDFGQPWPRGPMPDEALLPEVIVGLLDVAQASGVVISAAELNESMRSWFARQQDTAPPLTLTEEQLAAIRSRTGELLSRWRALPAGETLELTFP